MPIVEAPEIPDVSQTLPKIKVPDLENENFKMSSPPMINPVLLDNLESISNSQVSIQRIEGEDYQVIYNNQLPQSPAIDVSNDAAEAMNISPSSVKSGLNRRLKSTRDTQKLSKIYSYERLNLRDRRNTYL
jgi:hypothetical protein